MKTQVGDPPGGRLLPALVMAFAILFTSNIVAIVSGDSYDHKTSRPPPSPSPPPPYVYKSPPSPLQPYKSPLPSYYDEPVIKVVGQVYCYECHDWKDTGDSHIEKLLEGATVKVTCMADSKAYVAYGETKSYGKYSVLVEGFPYSKYGFEACKVDLDAAPKGSTCSVTTELNNGAKLKVESKSHEEVVLGAKHLAFAPKKPSKKCKKFRPRYHHKSPPLPPPPPPPLPPPLPPLPPLPRPPNEHKPSPPPPYKSPPPPPPMKSPPMKSPHVYKSPPPPPPMKSPHPPYHY